MNIEKIVQDYFSTNLSIYANNLFEFVRDLPYEINEAHTPKQLLQRGKGYCVSKHRLLKKLFGEIEIESNLCFVPFKFNQIYLPDHLKNRGYANKNGYHVFLKANINGKRINIDASFPLNLNKYYTVNQNRDGKLSQKITVGEYKEEFIAKTESDELEVKKKLSDAKGFDEEDEKWIDEYNSWLVEEG